MASDPGIECARHAKEVGRKVFPRFGKVAGVGLTKRKGTYAVKVNFAEAPSTPDAIPRQIEGVPVIYQVVGQVRKQAP